MLLSGVRCTYCFGKLWTAPTRQPKALSRRPKLPDDHLVYFVSDVVDALDLAAITTVYEEEERGYPPYHPVMMTKVLVYAYCVGTFSSRRIQRRLAEDVGFRVLAAGNDPDFHTIADFRKTQVRRE